MTYPTSSFSALQRTALVRGKRLAFMQGVRSKPHLRTIWTLLLKLEADWNAGWGQVEQWRLLPLHESSLIKIQHREAVFAPPPAEAPQGTLQAGQPPPSLSEDPKTQTQKATDHPIVLSTSVGKLRRDLLWNEEHVLLVCNRETTLFRGAVDMSANPLAESLNTYPAMMWTKQGASIGLTRLHEQVLHCPGNGCYPCCTRWNFQSWTQLFMTFVAPSATNKALRRLKISF